MLAPLALARPANRAGRGAPHHLAISNGRCPAPMVQIGSDRGFDSDCNAHRDLTVPRRPVGQAKRHHRQPPTPIDRVLRMQLAHQIVRKREEDAAGFRSATDCHLEGWVSDTSRFCAPTAWFRLSPPEREAAVPSTRHTVRAAAGAPRSQKGKTQSGMLHPTSGPLLVLR